MKKDAIKRFESRWFAESVAYVIRYAKSWIERDRLRRNIRSKLTRPVWYGSAGPGTWFVGVYVTRAAHGDMAVCRNMARETSDSEFMRASSRAGSGITIFMSHGLHSSDSYISFLSCSRRSMLDDSKWNFRRTWYRTLNRFFVERERERNFSFFHSKIQLCKLISRMESLNNFVLFFFFDLNRISEGTIESFQVSFFSSRSKVGIEDRAKRGSKAGWNIWSRFEKANKSMEGKEAERRNPPRTLWP